MPPMTVRHSTGDGGGDLPDAVLEAAVIWHARDREPEPDPAREAGRRREFEAWLAADPRHRRALDEAERLWAVLERPAERVIGTRRARSRSANAFDAAGGYRNPRQASRRIGGFRSQWAAAIAACLLVMLAGGTIWRDAIDVGLRSDYATAVGERLPVTLADGSRITLDTDSAIAVDLNATRRYVRLLRGQAWFDVSHDSVRPFMVETPEGTVRVTGTRFDVRRDDGSTVVSLAEGRVELTSPATAGQQPVALIPGQQSRLTASGPSRPVPFDRTAITAWLRGQFVFYDTPLSQVVATLNRYRRGRIVIVDDDLNRLKVSGVFDTGDPDAALAVIAGTLPVRVTRLTDYLALLR